MWNASSAQRAGIVLLIVCTLILPYFVYPVFIMKVMCFAIFVTSFNLLLGYVGLMSFGHAAFFGIGSYVAAWAAKAFQLTPELSIVCGTLAGAVLGAAFGTLAIRRQGIQFAMITMALAQLVYFICLQSPITGREDGLQGIPRGYLFGLFSLQSDFAVYGMVSVIFLACFLFMHRLVYSPFGEVLKAIRENEARSISIGYDAARYKLSAFVISASIAGMAGGTKAIVFGIVSLTDVHFTMSGQVVLMALLGGIGTMFGPLIGSGLMLGIENYLASLGAWLTVVQGLIFIVCVLVFRRGIVGSLQQYLRTKL